MNTHILTCKIIERGISFDNIAVSIGLNTYTLCRKLHNYEKITIGEALKLKDILELTNNEAYEIFLN